MPTPLHLSLLHRHQKRHGLLGSPQENYFQFLLALKIKLTRQGVQEPVSVSYPHSFLLYTIHYYEHLHSMFLQRKIFFSDLTSDKSRKLFRKFVTKWNDGDLPKVTYTMHDSLVSNIKHVSNTTKDNYPVVLTRALISGRCVVSHTYVCTHVCTFVGACVRAHIPVCVCTCVCLFVHAFVSVCVMTGITMKVLILFQLSNVDKIELGSVADSVSSWTSGKSSSEQFSPPPQPSKSRPIIGPTMIGPLPVSTYSIHYMCLLFHST